MDADLLIKLGNAAGRIGELEQQLATVTSELLNREKAYMDLCEDYSVSYDKGFNEGIEAAAKVLWPRNGGLRVWAKDVRALKREVV